MRFLGNVLATVIGIFVFLMLCLFGIVLIGTIFGGVVGLDGVAGADEVAADTPKTLLSLLITRTICPSS